MTEVGTLVGKNMLKKYNTNFSALLKLILDMSEEQQSVLLQHAQGLFDKRKRNRIPCLIPTYYYVHNKSHHSFILDINDSGAFIETNEGYPVGYSVVLEYFDPFKRKPLKVSGKIVWSGPHSVGIKFSDDHGTLH